MTRISTAADRLGRRLNWVVERLCALLVALMVMDVWLEIVSRYMVNLHITWTEELARYPMDPGVAAGRLLRRLLPGDTSA